MNISSTCHFNFLLFDLPRSFKLLFGVEILTQQGQIGHITDGSRKSHEKFVVSLRETTELTI